jgi:antitoxin (DNA-binding transcriptional repressor) of toxin-antitoxin stability system
MIQVTIDEAQRRLPELLAMVQAGEGMEIYAESGWIFRVGALPPTPIEGERPETGFGSCRGLIWMADDFDAPLDEMPLVPEPLVQQRPPRPRPPVTGVPKAGQYEGRFNAPDDFK